MPLFLIWTIQILIIPTLSPLIIGIIRKIKARLQNCKGASIFQPYRDIRKLFSKDEVISLDASSVFRMAPYIIFSTTLLISASIPIFTSAVADNPLSDFITIVYIMAISVFALMLAGLDTGNAFGNLGSSREAGMTAAAETGLIFSFLSMAFIAHSTNLFIIYETIQNNYVDHSAPAIIAFVAFVIILLSETSRYPFDNPATHLELTMTHEAMILEYSGKRLALVEWSAHNKFLIFLTLAVNIFLPSYGTNSLGLYPTLFSIGIYLSKILALGVFVALLESSIAKFRFFRLSGLLFSSFILSLIAITITM